MNINIYKVTFSLYQLLIFLNLLIVYLFRQRDYKKKVSIRGRLVTVFCSTQPVDRKRTTFQGWPWRRLENVSKTSCRCFESVLKSSWKHLEDAFARRLEDVLKTSWQDVLKTYDQDEYIGLEDVFWRRMTKANLFALMKTSYSVLKTSSEDKDERRLQDVLKMSSSRRMFAGISYL